MAIKVTAAMRDADYCYLTTSGRVTGNAHTVEIWFAVDGTTLYVLAGGGHSADFVRNAKKTPGVGVRIGKKHFDSTARIVTARAEDARARRLLLEKYGTRYSGDLDEWGRTALPVAFDLAGAS